MGSFYPLLVQNFALPLYDLSKGTSRFKYGHWLQKSQWLPLKEIAGLQNRNLRTLLKHAYDSVPYYKRAFKNRSLLPSDIKNVDDLVKLPILTKADIRTNFHDLISRSFQRKDLIPYQSGGTGNPIKFYITKESLSWEVAGEFRAYGWAGYRLGDRCFMIWGSPTDLAKSKRLISRFTKALEKVIVVDAYIMSDEALNRYAYLLRDFKPEIIRGYADSVHLVAKYLLDKAVDDVRPRAVITSGETLPYYKRKVIEEVFDCPVFDYYGSREVGAMAAQCEQHCGYHITAENVVMEIVRDGDHVAEGEEGVIVVTNLRNFGMPFIRYKIDDVGRPSNDVCNCGRGLPLLSSISGRVYEFMSVYDKQLRRTIPVGPGLIAQPLLHLPLKQYRIIQESLDKIIVKVVKDKGYSEKHTDFLINHVRKSLGGNITIEVEFADYLAPLPSGKRSSFISKIDSFEQKSSD